MDGSNQTYVGSEFDNLTFGWRNSIDALVEKDILNDDTFMKTLEAASIIDYSAKATKKLFIFSLEKDSWITPLNT